MAQAHFTLSAFADEISPDLNEQLDVLERCGIRHLELRSVWKTNVLDLTDEQVREVKRQLDARGFRLSAIGSPIGKVKITDPFEPHLQRFRRAVELCKVFETPNIRIFSYYPPDAGAEHTQASVDWRPYRAEILDRMQRKLEIAEQADVRLLHENEHRIYGDSPERVLDLLTALDHPQFRAVYDPANYVFCGYDPWEAWLQTRDWTVHFHIKDWIRGEPHARPAGEGQGRIPDVLADAVQRGYRGFATLEPHLLGGGPTGGVTGPDLFPKAVAALRAILDRLSVSYD
ncbi:3-dehydroshikimate dehydratase [bacterium HR36]|nr:3-dehydroshikimate dehydratase [bacterium HR36]